MRPSRLRAVLLCASLFLLSGCLLGHRVKVFDANRHHVGTVRVRNDELAVIYALKRWRIGVMDAGIVTRGGVKAGRVDAEGFIRDPAGQLIGKFKNGNLCVSLYDDVLGFLEEDVSPRPGGGACMLLFLVKPAEEGG